MVPANQGSRSGLVAWTVVATILFVTATVFAIYFYVAANDSATKLNRVNEQYREVITEGGLTGDSVTRLKALREAAAERAETDPPTAINGSMPLLDVAVTALDEIEKATGFKDDRQARATVRELARTFPAAPTTGPATQPGNNNAPGNANQPGTVIAADGSVAGALSTLTARLGQAYDTIAKLQAEARRAADAEAKRAQARADFASGKEVLPGRKEVDEQLSSFTSQTADVFSSASQAPALTQQKLEEIRSEYSEQLIAAQEAANQANTARDDLARENEQLKSEVQKMQSRLSGLRVNASDNVVRQADGQVIRVPGGNIVYISLGQGEQISPGMTFQVYDKIEGVPPVGDNDDDTNMPVGKASIEVVRVGPTSSEARVVRVQPGQNITEGDLIANLVYDGNVRYNFMVFGNFDLDQNGAATMQDAEVIKRLVTQWGGRLTDRVNVDTDFVVLGKEPEIPAFTREELDEPLNRERLDKATAEANAYEEVRRLAQEYNIPILNQNRFLYFVGFYELSRR